MGLGTFAPVKKKNIEDHHIHPEYFELDEKTAERLNQAKSAGRRIIAVGTTSTRVLETCAQKVEIPTGAKLFHPSGGSLLTPVGYCLKPQRKNTELFIYPPHKFKFVDAMVTNFHLPKSTLLALVSAFVSYPNLPAGRQVPLEKFTNFKLSLIGKAYQEAIAKNYRFFSFGDVCFIT